MKVTIIINEMDIRGGTHKQVLRLSQYLKSCGCDLVIVTKYLELEKTYPEFKDMEIEYLYKENSSFKISNKNVLSKIRNRIYMFRDAVKLVTKIPGNCDIINVHDNHLYTAILLTRIYLRKKVKIIWQINDLPLSFHVGVAEDMVDTWKDKIRRMYFRLIAKCVDEITVNVTKNAERVKQCLGRDAKVFYCGVDVNENLEKHSYNIKDNTVKILSSGVFFPYRNYETLVDVVENLKNKNINVHLDIIGATDRAQSYSDEIKNLVKEKDLENEITIWGQVDDAKYTELHNGADMFAFININQSWGLAVFEAMSCGLPVIVSESVGAIELLHNEEDAVIVDPENVEAVSNVVLKLMSDKDYYNKISENAYNAVKDFTWDKLYSERMLDLFKSFS